MSDFKREWLWAICYHPMILLIDEDAGEPKILERIPPWGAETLKGYWPRLECSIALAEKDDSFKFSLDISGVELERLEQERKDLIERIKKLIELKRVEAVGGDYSQPHFQTFLSASSLQQFYVGLKTFERILGTKPDVFAHQEPQIFEQLPQILNALGYRYACATMFPWWILAVDERGPLIHSHFGMIQTSEPDSFAFWKGADGAEIPIYLRSDVTISPEAIVTHARFLPKIKFIPSALISRFVSRALAKYLASELPLEPHKGLWSSPKMICEFPDLTEPNKGRIKNMKKRGRLVTISEGIEEITRRWQPKTKVRFGTSFAHAEGTWAEKLIRECWRAESRLVCAQSWCSLAKSLANHDYDKLQFETLWKKLLKAQHHDVHWVEPIDLKNKALGWLKGVVEESDELEGRAISSLSGNLKSLNGQLSALRIAGRDPHKIKWPHSLELKAAMPSSSVILEDAHGAEIKGQIKSAFGGTAELTFSSDIGLGFDFLKVKSTKSANIKSGASGCKFVGKNWMCEVDERGWLKAIGINGAEYSPLARLCAWHPKDGWLEERSASKLVVEEGDVCSSAKVKLSFGRIPVEREVIMYREMPLVMLRFLFDFDGDELGISWEDETKLCLALEFSGLEDVWHAIPFGAVKMPIGYGFCSVGWTALENKKKNMGLAFLTRGHPRQFYRDGRLYCTLAWGGTRFSLRIPTAWDKIDRFDYRLYGKHTLEFALAPYAGDWRSARIPIYSQKFLNPARVDLCEPEANFGSRRLLEIDGNSPLIVGIEKGAGETVFATGHECVGKDANLDAVFSDSLKVERLSSLSGNDLSVIRPFQIFRAHLTPSR